MIAHDRGPSAPGGFVVIVGPDGVGKTTVARALLDAHDGPTAYFHFRPPTDPSRLRAAVPDGDVPAVDKHPSGSRIGGWLRLARSVWLFRRGYARTIRPALARGALVVGDRWAYGYLVQPTALRFFGPASLARLAMRWLPHPDLVVALTAAPELIRHRKRELTLTEIRAELERWAAIPGPRVVTVDNSGDPSAAVREIRRLLETR